MAAQHTTPEQRGSTEQNESNEWTFPYSKLYLPDGAQKMAERITDPDKKFRITRMMSDLESKIERGKMLPTQGREQVQKTLPDILDARRKLIDSILAEAPNIPIGCAPGAHDGAFKEYGGAESMLENELEKIEDLAYAETPDPEGSPRNRLYVKNNPNSPHFGEISRLEDELKKIRAGIDESAQANDREATEKRISRVELVLSLIKSKDPVGLARFESVELNRPNEKISKPIKLLALAGVSVSFIISAITTVRKLLRGGELEIHDGLTLAYGLAFLKLAGFDIAKGKNGMDFYEEKLAQIKSNTNVVTAIEHIGKHESVDAAQELHVMLSEDAGKRKELWNLLKSNENGLSKESMEKFTDAGGQNKLVRLLCGKTGITDADRRAFIGMLYDLNIHKEHDLAAIAASIPAITKPSPNHSSFS